MIQPMRFDKARGALAVAVLAVVVGVAAPAGRAGATGTMVPLRSGNETIQAYLAAPSPPPVGASSPALVIVHEWYGLSDWVKSVADSFAARGYLAVAPDLYRGKLATAEQPELAHELSRGLPEERAMRDLRATASYLRSRHDLRPGRMAVIGFCMGGGLALRAALDRGPFDATVVCYGSPVTDVARLRTLRGPVLGVFGANDQGIGPDQTGPFEDGLKKAGHLYAVKVYPGVGHAFLRAPGSTEGEAQAAAAWEEIHAFLAQQIGRTASASRR